MEKGSASTGVLILDDNPVWMRAVASCFERQGLTCVLCTVWDEHHSTIAECEPDIILLGLAAGLGQGLNRLSEIQQRHGLPIIAVVEDDRDCIDRVLALELGADDSVCRRLEMRELVARVRAILRRIHRERVKTQTRAMAAGRWRFEGWELSDRLHRLLDPRGLPVPLTKGQYSLLRAFLTAPQRPLTRAFLVQATSIHENVFDRSIDVQVLRLRRKLRDDPGYPRLIRTERGIGYVFTPAVERV
ncbi:response regulator transcription factor [Pseudomonas sp. R2.Fl]|nr:response regulator transcription factor [Pseudomonas sp. R2.Fl]